jgi:preprotein translocase subunit SecA
MGALDAVSKVAQKFFGTKHERTVKGVQPLVAHIATLEPRFKAMSDAELQAMTWDFRARLSRGATLEEILPEAYAAVREASWRSLDMRHYDVQMVGGIVLHQGRIAEMRTGEGKTLVATLPIYLNALTGKGVHLVTVNDYLALRDAEWMGRLYRFMGLSVGTIQHGQKRREKQIAYGCDITYGTNNEFGFDYLRDNMKTDVGMIVQRGLNFAIVDEVDSILVDEARTPLIISGPSNDRESRYDDINACIPRMQREIDYTLDEESRAASLTEDGIDKVERMIGIDNLYDPSNIELLHLIDQALKAHTLYKRDKDYVVKENQVVIVDPFTGRLMPGRRWSDGLHQAVEAKEGVKVEDPNQTLATITFQKYFLKYDKLAGMTGTADTEAAEFEKIYKLEVVVIPTNKPNVRDDWHDQIYKTEEQKFRAAIREIEELHKQGRPVLVGTVSVEKSELASKLLKRRGLPHNVLNAKHHLSEADIVAQAGAEGGITLSTNMAGRGTDILLGGNPEGRARSRLGPPDEGESEEAYEARFAAALEVAKVECAEAKQRVLDAGGLHIVGTERHESRRIDNQLRGRAGRQGDPGSSRFYLSLEDDLLRIFGSEKISGMMERLGMEDDVPIEHKWLSKSVENAQKKVEGHNFGIRKNLLEYDDVMSQQRDAVYGIRQRIIDGEQVREMIVDMAGNVVDTVCDSMIDPKAAAADVDFDALGDELTRIFGATFEVSPDRFADLSRPGFVDDVVQQTDDAYDKHARVFVESVVRHNAEQGRTDEEDTRIDAERQLAAFECTMLLEGIDYLWRDHLKAMDHLRGGIGLRGYGQRNPLLEYKKEGFEMFGMMMELWDERAVSRIFQPMMRDTLTEGTIARLEERRQLAEARRKMTASGSGGGASAKQGTVRREHRKIGRNDPCHCGSGKKYKKCCLRKDAAANA